VDWYIILSALVAPIILGFIVKWFTDLGGSGLHNDWRSLTLPSVSSSGFPVGSG